MWLNKFEEKEFSSFRDIINANETASWSFVFEDGVKLTVTLEGEYESDNGLEPDEEGYEEYSAMLFRVSLVEEDPKNIYHEGDLIEISYHDLPIRYFIV